MKSFDTFSNTGKCDSCQSVTHLDEMVKKNFTKGLYHCVDCETVDYIGMLQDKNVNKVFVDLRENVDDKTKPKTKVKKFVGFLVG